MDKYREVLEALKETLKMVANRDDVIKKSIDLESSSTDFAGYLYHLLEEDLKNSGLLDEEINVNPDDSFNKRIRLISNYISTVVAEDENRLALKQDVKPFHIRTYRNNSLLREISEAGFDVVNIENLVKSVKTNTNSIGKTFSFDYDNFEEGVSETSSKTNFNHSNEVLNAFWNAKQISHMGDVLTENLSNQANNVREGACGVIYGLFAAKGYKMNDIISGKVTEQDAQNVYERIDTIGQISESLKDNKLTAEESEKLTQKLKELNEALLDDFLLGTRNMCEEYDNTIKYEDQKDIEKESCIYNENSRITAALFSIIGTNYFQDPKFVKNVEASYARKPLLMDGAKFDLKQAAMYLSDRTAGASRLLNLFDRTASFCEVETTKCSNSDMFEKYIGLQTELNAIFYDDLSRMRVNTLYNNFVEENEALLDEIKDSVDWSLYLKKVFKEGKLFNDISIDFETQTIKTGFTVDDLMEEHKEYLKNEFVQDIEKNLDRTLEKDIKQHTISEEELAQCKDLNDRYQAYSAWLNKKMDEQIAAISNKVEEYKVLPDEKITFSVYSNTTQIATFLENYKKKGNFPVSKYSLFKNDYVLKNFVEKKYKEDDKAVDENDLDKYKNSLSILSEKPENFIYEHFLSPDQKKIYSELEEKYNSAENKNDFISRAVDTTNDIYQGDIYKKMNAPAVATNTKIIIQKSYETFLDELKKTSDLDEHGEPTGNSKYFKNMYNSIKSVSEMSANDSDFNKKYKESQEYINAYINKRDSFFKVHSYGRERLRIAKQVRDLNVRYMDRLEECDKKIKEEKAKITGVLGRDERINIIKDDVKEYAEASIVTRERSKSFSFEPKTQKEK